ncbi:hypothetical protein J3F82_006332, partial [Coemansia sp. RSA 637]
FASFATLALISVVAVVAIPDAEPVASPEANPEANPEPQSWLWERCQWRCRGSWNHWACMDRCMHPW